METRIGVATLAKVDIMITDVIDPYSYSFDEKESWKIVQYFRDIIVQAKYTKDLNLVTVRSTSNKHTIINS